MKRKKRAWGPSNPLWRYLNKRKSRKSRSTPSVRRTRKRGVSMARRKHYRRSRGSGGIGGIVKPALFGAIASYVAPMVPINVPYKTTLAGAAGGYFAKKSIEGALIGAVSGMVVPSLIGGVSSGQSSQSSVVVYG